MILCALKRRELLRTTMTFLKGTVTVANIGILLRNESMKYLCSASNAYMMISMTIMRFYMIPTK